MARLDLSDTDALLKLIRAAGADLISLRPKFSVLRIRE